MGFAFACSSYGEDGAPNGGGIDAGSGDADSGGLSPDTTDATNPDANGACDRRPFGQVRNVAELNSPGVELSVRLTADERTAFLTSIRDGGLGSTDIYATSREDVGDPFGEPQLVPILNTEQSEDHASISFDGLLLYFASARDAGAQSDIFVSRRSAPSLAFETPAKVMSVNDDALNDSFPYIAADGDLYFASDRGPAELRLYVAPKSTTPSAVTPFGPSTELWTLNEPGTITNNPVVTRDGLTIYFASTRSTGGAQGSSDIWVARRTSSTTIFGTPENVTELNSPSADRPTWISNDGCRMYFTSDRAGGSGGLDIWMASR